MIRNWGQTETVGRQLPPKTVVAIPIRASSNIAVGGSQANLYNNDYVSKYTYY